ncbi:UNVERIFIED_CONTAM: hypothetical protein Slati_0127100 [Sesamum latifolium]|uniref:Uncharacterized protein n=1 Tax=Sesamum latifolium TaxID=2727402 RepID=A0AAW2Y9G1_9LAMI
MVKRYGDGFQAAGRRSLLSATTKGDTALVAALDGTIYLLEVGSMRPLWSFSSGPQIYSSYQAPVSDKENASGVESNYFIDCGDDWELAFVLSCYLYNEIGLSVSSLLTSFSGHAKSNYHIETVDAASI